MRLLILILLSIISGICSANEGDFLIGTWNWKPNRGSCPERHHYFSEGRASTESGDEILQKTYSVKLIKDGLYRISASVISTNGKKDCLGSLTEVGSTSTTFIYRQNYGGYLTCASENGMSCYGSASLANPNDEFQRTPSAPQN